MEISRVFTNLLCELRDVGDAQFVTLEVATVAVIEGAAIVAIKARAR